MNKKKTLIALLAIVAIVSVSLFALVACDDGKTNNEKVQYGYVKTEINVESSLTGLDSAFSPMKAALDTLYKNSYVEVSDEKIEWTVDDDNKTIFTVTKDGENYNLYSDEMKENFKSMFSEIGATDISLNMIGKVTSDGFEMATTVNFSVYNMPISMSMVFTFKSL